MAKTRKEKKELVSRYSDLIKGAKGIIIVKGNGITPNMANAFRKGIYADEAKFHVVKNNLFKIALKDNNYSVIESLELGEHAVLFTKEEIVAPAKELKKFLKEAEAAAGENTVSIVGGFLDGEELTVEQAMNIADMPSKEESISMILGIIDQAMGGVVNVLNDAPRSLVTILDMAFKE
jgi:large subunit ribosomal protein L10